jgi:regulator of protease activity HflC (stomatin/prohibitin superfamily)
MMFIFKFIVRRHERGLLFKRGDFKRFVEPGEYRIWNPLGRWIVEVFDISKARFEHRLSEFLIKEFEKDVKRLFTVVETGADQVAVIYERERLVDVIGPASRALYWKGVVDVRAKLIDIDEQSEVDYKIAKVIASEAGGRLNDVAARAIYTREVPEGHVGLLSIDGKIVDELAPGLHSFWKFNRAVAIGLIDMRVRALEVSGQEILTKDKVSLRINLTANYQFVDALKAAKAVKDPLDFLYKEIQFGLRAAVGTRTLDALLEDKGAMDRVVFDHVAEKFAEIGLDVKSIGVKDIILPGDMKELLAKVVEAEKAAQANVIRRREETNATRSLLNTAKVMEDNSVALRLKELETLEKVTEKIGNISVYGGLDSVMSELVRIKR